jgi:hypothetical protein
VFAGAKAIADLRAQTNDILIGNHGCRPLKGPYHLLGCFGGR